MSNILEYKGYYTRIEYDNVDKVLYGKIEGINDFVNFEINHAENIENEFHMAVDDYLIYCKEKGIEPDKTYSGKFNVRISKELHKKIVFEAFKQGMSLNQYVERAIGLYTDVNI